MIQRPNFYAGGGSDRADRRRSDAAWFDRLRADPKSRLVPVWRSQNLFGTIEAGQAPVPILPSIAALDGIKQHLNASALVLLGLAEETAYFALDLSEIDDPAEARAAFGAGEFGGGEFVDLRRYGPLIGRWEGALLAYARGMLHWHGRHRFCSVCGHPTASVEAGHARRCTNSGCATQHFPRTDPAVIMLVTDGARCLLGRQAAWVPGMHSTLAGFVEPGESLEDAVAREVREETGIRVASIRYHSSQPWPFPASLMLGFTADATSTEIAVNRAELEDARWFTRAELLASPENDVFRLPRRDSIARRLIEDWLGRED
jgi:NAD+ diphosphatase